MNFIVLFALSLITLTALVYIKNRELRKGGQSSILKAVGRADESVIRVQKKVSFVGTQISQSVQYIITVYIREFFVHIYKRTKNSIDKRRDIVMGKKDLRNTGSASFYLKKIIEEKGNGERGVIVDHDLPTDTT